MKIWDVGSSTSPGSLRLTWGYDGLDHNEEEYAKETNEDVIGATGIEAIKTDLKKIAVAFRNAIVKIFDLDSGKEFSKLQSDISYGSFFRFSFCIRLITPPFSDGTPSSQINKIVSHPTMPLLATAHEDKYIRLFDITTGMGFIHSS